MKTQFYLLLLIIPTMLTIGSCTPEYIPNRVNTPFFSNVGELQVSASAGISGIDPQVAFSLSDHVGLMANGSFFKRTSDTTADFHKHNFVEGGCGYYTKLGKIVKFETFGGVGTGSLWANYDYGFWVNRNTLKCTRYFIQPSVGVSTKIVDGGIAARFVVLKLKQESLSNTGIFFEPVVSAKVGYQSIRALIQVGVSLPLNLQDLEFEYQPFLFSIGFQALLGRKYESGEQTK